jgi:hypothetical protein
VVNSAQRFPDGAFLYGLLRVIAGPGTEPFQYLLDKPVPGSCIPETEGLQIGGDTIQRVFLIHGRRTDRDRDIADGKSG